MVRILQISKKIPYPQRDGESIAIVNLASTLTAHDVTIDLMTLNTTKHYADPSVAKSNLDFYNSIEIIPHVLELSAVDALKHLLQSNSYNIERFKSAQLSQQLIERLTSQTYDVIILETLYVSQYIDIIRQYSAALVIMRAHNIEHHIWDEIAALEKQLVKKKYVESLAQSLREYELEQISNYDAVLTVAVDDYEWYRQKLKPETLLLNPIGLDLSKYSMTKTIDNDSVLFGFIGALDWTPNAAGLDWFLTEVWPGVHQSCPQSEFHIAGRNMPQHIQDLTGEGIVIHGEVDSAIAFMVSMDVMLAPLFIASGIRVKILEAMALGKPVITTTTALKGNHAKDKEHIILANSSLEFISEMTRLCHETVQNNPIGPAAKQFISKHFNQETLTAELVAFLKTVQKDRVQL